MEYEAISFCIFGWEKFIHEDIDNKGENVHEVMPLLRESNR